MWHSQALRDLCDWLLRVRVVLCGVLYAHRVEEAGARGGQRLGISQRLGLGEAREEVVELSTRARVTGSLVNASVPVAMVKASELIVLARWRRKSKRLAARH